jgi:phage portal protein BeeE
MNPKTTLYDWLRMYVEARDIYGVLYMYLELDSSGTPRAWRIIDNTCLDYVAGAWYERNPNGQRVRLEEQALLAFSRTSLVQTGGALSACLESVLLDNTITEKFAAWFKNAPLISSALSVPGIVSDRIAEQIRSTWVANYTGAGSLAVLGNGSSYQQYVPAFRDLDIASIRGATESRITTSFGVPPLVLYAAYALERATYSNLEQAFKAFYVNTVLPLAREIEHELTYTLLPLYESPDDLASERVRFVLDMSAVTILQLLQLAAPQAAEDATEQAAQSEERAHAPAHAVKQAEVFSPEYIALEERFTKAMQRYVDAVMDDLEAEARLGAGNV